jgi:hypothetical protein
VDLTLAGATGGRLVIGYQRVWVMGRDFPCAVVEKRVEIGLLL